MNGPRAKLVRTFGSANEVRYWMFRLSRLALEVQEPDHVRIAETQAAQDTLHHRKLHGHRLADEDAA